MEISKGMAWFILLLVAMLAALAGYGLSGRGASASGGPAGPVTLDTLISQTQAEYQLLEPLLEEKLKQIFAELEVQNAKYANQPEVEYHGSVDEYEIAGETSPSGLATFKTAKRMHENIEMTLDKLKYEINSREIVRDGSVSYPYRAVLTVHITSQRRRIYNEVITLNPDAKDIDVLKAESNKGYWASSPYGLHVLHEPRKIEGASQRLKDALAKAEEACRAEAEKFLFLESRKFTLRFSAATKQWEWESTNSSK